MSDGPAPERPRPRYGEYASPAEVAARGGVPAEPIDPALIPRDAPPAAPAGARPARASAPQGGSRLADRVLTVALLAYGLINTLGAIGMFTDPQQLLDLMQIDAELADYAGQRMAGVASIVVMLAGWCATTWWVWRRWAAGRSTWWVALVAGIVFTFVGTLIVSVPLIQDPGVLDALLEMQGA
ncbi:DUF6264 family protein [Microbacterium sp. ZXX196]|uniref:DUF6264 family protein n=1 Tax=Microbacterium sp. ZXX196 TaxID=2609291 RepID=UPI0012B8279F|nr:hypothetical protein [Microbacterium sp. ZXX196]